MCSCQFNFYKIRPYTFELLNAIHPFFEVIAISKMPFPELVSIIDQIEDVLNLPVVEKNRQTINERQEFIAK